VAVPDTKHEAREAADQLRSTALTPQLANEAHLTKGQGKAETFGQRVEEFSTCGVKEFLL